MKVNYETGFQIGVMEARLKKMRENNVMSTREAT